MLKLRDIRAVLTVAKSGSVSGAATRLNLSQPAISHAVKRVESDIGFQLFDRSHSGMTPTPVGNIVVRRALNACQHLDFQSDEIRKTVALKGLRPAVLETFERTVSRSQLRVLVELGHCRHIDCAARRIGVSKTVIYRLLREMEAILGADIFIRGETFTPTALGNILIRRANLIFAELRVLREEVGQFTGHMAGRIVVGTLPSARNILVPKAVAELSRAYPEIRVSMIDKPYEEMATELDRGNLDIIVGLIRRQGPDSSLRDYVLFQDTMTVLARSGHALLEQDCVTLLDLERAKWVMPRVGAPSRNYFEGLFTRHGLPTPRDIVETDSLIALRSLLIEDDRLTLTSPFRVALELELGLMRVVRYPIENFSALFGYIVRSGGEMSPCLSAFVQILERLSRSEAEKRAMLA